MMQCRGVVARARLARQPQDEAAHQSHGILRAFGVAAEPEQVIRDAAREIAIAAPKGKLLIGRLQTAERADGLVGQNPGIFTGVSLLHGDRMGVVVVRSPGQAARHDAVGVAIPGKINAQRHRSWLQAVVSPNRCCRERENLLANKIVAAAVDPGDQLFEFVLRKFGGINRVIAVGEDRAVRKSTADDQSVEVGFDVISLQLLAAPPSCDRRDCQVLADQLPAQTRQEAHDRFAFEDGAAQGIGDDDVARAYRGNQARDSQHGIGAQLERVAEFRIDAAENQIHLLQSVERLEVDLVVAHGKVGALDKRKPKIACQIGMLEIGFVVGAGRHQDDQRIVAAGQLYQPIAERLEKTGQAVNMRVAEKVRQSAGHDDAVLKRVTGTGGRLGAVGEDPPFVVGGPDEVHCEEVKIDALSRFDTVKRTQEILIAEDERWG